MDMRMEWKDGSIEGLKKARGLGEGGKVQRFVDGTCIRLMGPYTPFKTGAMQGSATRGTVIGSGQIRYISPYARFQYYGKVMIDPETGSTWAKKGGKKELTSRNLVHNTLTHPKAGPFWFERMKADHLDDILKGAKAEAERTN